MKLGAKPPRNTVKRQPRSIHYEGSKYIKGAEKTGCDLGFVRLDYKSFFFLTRLNLAGNNLLAIPPGIYSMPQLQILNLNDNVIFSIPYSINRLASLKELHLAKNTIEDVFDLDGLVSLELLDLSFNDLCYVSARLKRVKYLFLEPFSIDE